MFTNIMCGIANLFANAISTACFMFFFDEPVVDKDLL